MDEGDDYGIGDTDSIIGDNHSICSTGSMMTGTNNYVDIYIYIYMLIHICIYIYIYIYIYIDIMYIHNWR
jgi:hypothetical protein